jgi:hypothetical protein
VTYRVTPEYLSNAAASTDNTAAEIDIILGQIRAYVVNLEAWRREVRAGGGGPAVVRVEALAVDQTTSGSGIIVPGESAARGLRCPRPSGQ